jgi:hypothetical protein
MPWIRVAFATDSTITSALAILTTFLSSKSYTKIDTSALGGGDESGEDWKPAFLTLANGRPW